MIINRKIIWLAILLSLFILSSASSAETEEDLMNKNILEEQLESLNIKELEYILEDIINTSSEYYRDINVRDILFSILKGKNILDFKGFAKIAIKTVVNELLNNLTLISQIVIIAVACSILSNLQNSFEKDSISQLANYVCYIVLSMMIINSFTLALELGKGTVTKMVDFMQVILPILLTLLTAIGSPGTKILFNPVVLGTVNIIGTLVKNVVFPLIFFYFYCRNNQQNF